MNTSRWQFSSRHLCCGGRNNHSNLRGRWNRGRHTGPVAGGEPSPRISRSALHSPCAAPRGALRKEAGRVGFGSGATRNTPACCTRRRVQRHSPRKNVEGGWNLPISSQSLRPSLFQPSGPAFQLRGHRRVQPQDLSALRSGAGPRGPGGGAGAATPTQVHGLPTKEGPSRRSGGLPSCSPRFLTDLKIRCK